MKRLTLIGALLLTLGAPPVAVAQHQPAPPAPPPAQNAGVKSRTLTLVVPGDRQQVFRLLPSPDAKQQAQLPVVFNAPKGIVTFDPAGLGKAPRVAVDDTATGNTAIVPLPAGDTLTLHRSDFDHIRHVEVKVTYDARPVQSARVTLTTADGSSRSQAIDPGKQGTAIFEDVPAGKAKLTILYGDRLTATQDVDLSTDHPGDRIAIAAPVSSKVPTLDVPAVSSAPSETPGAVPTAPGAAPAPTASAPQGNPLVSLLNTLIGLAAIGGLGYLLYRWFQSGGMSATLKKAGIEVSGPTPPSDAGTPWQPNAPAPPVVTDPSLCPFCGQKKDAAGNCACSLSPGMTTPAGAAGNGGVAVAGAPIVATQPRLIATMGVYSGSIFPLAGGVTVGREPSNGIALGNDTTVSRRHASLRNENGTWFVTDEGSSNGVFVNGVRINGTQPLRPGDEVQIGNTRFRFEM